MTDLILSSKTFLAKSLGCRTNQAEIESISMELLNYGFENENSKKTPDIVLLNTCVVTSKAEKETRKEIRSLRKKFPNAFLVVLGCAVTEKEKFKTNLPEADLLISNKNKNEFAKLIPNLLNSRTKHCKFIHDRDKNSTNYLLNHYQQSGRKFIKIQDGCNNFCSFCLTSLLRGKPINVPQEKIIEEINVWTENGIKEFILTGINIGLYGKQERDPSIPPTAGLGMTDLIKRILSETKTERITFSSIYPEMLTDDFLTLVVGNPRTTQCFHLSLQSGSQTILARMNRKTKLDELLKKLQWIKLKNPLFTFRADIITGFPDETEIEFQETIDFINNAKISFAHIFTYSARKGTSAYEMIKSQKWQDLPESVKKERSKKIRKLVEKIRGEEAGKMIGRIFQCLIVKKSGSVIASEAWQSQNYNNSNSMRLLRRPADGGTPRNDRELWEGITKNGWPIKIKDQKSKIKDIKGRILPVEITGFKNDYLLGEIVSLPTKGIKTSGISTDPSAF